MMRKLPEPGFKWRSTRDKNIASCQEGGSDVHTNPNTAEQEVLLDLLDYKEALDMRAKLLKHERARLSHEIDIARTSLLKGRQTLKKDLYDHMDFLVGLELNRGED